METSYVPISEWMNKEHMVCVCMCVYIYIYTHTYIGILFSHEKKGYPAICNNMDGPWGHYVKWDVRQRKTNTWWHHLYVESKKAELIKTE